MRHAVGAALAALSLLLVACSGDEYVAPPAQVRSDDAVDPTVAAATLSALQQALVDGDAATAAGLGAGTEPAELLSALTRNARALRLVDVALTYVTETGRTRGRDGWEAQVAVTWRIRGHDDAPARTEVPVTFADGGRRIAAIGAPGARLPVWLSAPVEVRRSGGAVVVAATSPSRASAYARLAAAAVRQARQVLGGRTGVVVEVAADQEAFGRALDVDGEGYAAIAAITASVDGTRLDDSPVHVFLNPPVYDALDPVAAQVVMTHEAVHAMTDATLARGVPLWLVEGFADYVALRDVNLALSKTAGQLLARVRKGGAPRALPGDAEFDPSAAHLGTVYEASWQVCVTLAERGGEAALVELYRAVLDGTPVAQALRAGFGWSVADLTRAWRARLAALAGV